jgi:ADP-ribose pyrophosphatase YjhB (NUDIX family)
MDVESPGAELMADRDNDGEAREVSAGGIVVDEGKVLLVRTRNLKGDLVWTFPKGHVEAGESARQTALREVEEETGYRCRVLESIGTVRYHFQRSGRLINKRVSWYWMKAGAKLGKPDEAEVYAVRWSSFKNAEGLLKYPSDRELLHKTLLRFPEVQA